MGKGDLSAYDLKRAREGQPGQPQQQPGQPQAQPQTQPKQPKRQPKNTTAPIGGSGRGQVPDGGFYVVQAGDNPARLAQRFGGDQRKFAALLQANGLGPGAMLQPGQTLQVPEWFGGKWSPNISQGYMDATQSAEAAQGMKSGPGFANGLSAAFAAPSAKANGYVPSYFQDPKTVTRYYNLLQSAPSGAGLPSWLDANAVTQAYKWFEFRNGGKSPDQWGYLPADDPGLSFLAAMGTPPPDALMPHEQGFNKQAVYPQPGVTGLGQPTGQTNPYAADFDWMKLSDAQKSEILGAKDFQMQKVPLSQQGLILSDPTFDLWGKAARGELPWWQPMAFSAMSSPISAPLVQGVGMAAPLMASGKVTEGALLGGGMILMGYGAQWEGPVGDYARFVGNALMYASQKAEQVGGLVSQMTGGASDELTLQKQAENPLGAPLLALVKLARNYKSLDNPSLGDLVTGITAGEKNAVQAQFGRPLAEAVKGTLAGIAKQSGLDVTGVTELISRAESAGVDPQSLTAGQQKALAMWEAGKAYYETLSKGGVGNEKSLADLGKWVPGIPAPEGTVWVLGNGEPVPVHDGYGLEDARQRILQGEPGELVLADFQREYGISGQSSDFLLSAIYDPLNVLPDVAAEGRARWAEHKAGGVDVTTAAGAARAKIETLKAQAERAKPSMLGMANPIGETGQAFRDLVRTTLSGEEIKHLTPAERKLAGLTESGAIKELQPSGPGWWNKLTNLTPESKALISAQMAKENLGVLLNHLDADENVGRQMYNILDAAARGDMETVREMGAAFMDNPEFYTTVGAVRDFLPKMRELAANFDLANPNRELFWRVQELLGDDAGQVLKNFTDGEARPDFERLVRRAEASGSPEAKAFLESVKRGEVTAETLAESFKVFKDNRVAIHPQEFKALTLNAFYEHMGTWGVDFFKVEKASQFQEALRMMKGAQSLMLLDFSPSYLVNNFLNNRVMMAANGVLGLTPGRTIDRWLNRFGVTPARMSEGLGPAEQPQVGKQASGQMVARETAGMQPKTAEALVQEARHGEGIFTKAADAVGQVRSKTGVMSRVSGAVESQASKQMYFSAMQAYYGRQWRAGSGFERMPAALEMRLRNAGVDMAIFYRNIEGFLSPEDFEKLAQGATTRTVEGYVNDAAARLGKDPVEVGEMLTKLGVMDELRERVARAKTPEQVVKAFEAVEARAMDGVDRMIAGELQGRAEQIRNKVRAEGPAGALAVFNDIVLDNLERKFENDQIWDEAYAKMEEANNMAFLEQAARQNQAAWRRTDAFESAAMQGVMEGLGLDSEYKRETLARMAEQQETRRVYFEEKNKAYREFFKQTFPSKEAYKAARYTLDLEFNRKWQEVGNHTLKLQGEIDALFADEFGRVFGPEGKVSAQAYRAGVLKTSTEMHEAVTGFRNGLLGSDYAARKAAWEAYKPEYQAMWKERARANLEGANQLYKFGEPGPTMAADERQMGFSLNQVQAVNPSSGPSDAEIASWSAQPADNSPQMPAGERVNLGGVPDAAQTVGQVGGGQSANSPAAMARESAIFAVMNEFGMATADEAGRPNPNAKLEVLNMVRAYGPKGSEQVRTFGEITPEMARVALEKANAPALDVEQMVSEMWRDQGTPTSVAPQMPDGVLTGSEVPLAEPTKADVVRETLTRKAVVDLPSDLREPVSRIVREMLDEVKAGRKKSLLEFIKEKGGLDLTALRDVTGEEKVQRKWGPGLFSKRGLPLDELVRAMADEGYLTPGEVSNPMDNGGLNTVAEMIRRELAGEKAYSYFEEGKLAGQPQWYADIRGLKSKQAAVQMFLERMLNGNENAKFGMEPTATERAIKAEIFSRLGDLAATDGKMADATGHPFDYAGFDERMARLTGGLETGPDGPVSERRQALSDLFDEASILYRSLPQDAPEMYQAQIDAIYQRIDREGAKLAQTEKIGAEYARAGQAMEAQKAHNERLMTREAFKEKLASEFGLPDEQVEAVSAVTDARAEAWARMNGRTPEEWYQTHLQDVVRGGEGQNAQSLTQTEPRPQEFKHYTEGQRVQHWEVPEREYIDERFRREQISAARNVDGWNRQLAETKPTVKKYHEIEQTIKYWERQKSKTGPTDADISRWHNEYVEMTRKAISSGEPVPQEVIDQYPEFTKAQDARARYEKGRHTSFGNRSIGVDDSMQAEYGYKIKRQDGKAITAEQAQHIQDVTNEVASVVGDLRDLYATSDLTIAHTNGKHPFLSDVGGMYHPGDKTVSIGIAGTPAGAHELGHWLDIEAGDRAKAESTWMTKSQGSKTSTSLADADGKYVDMINTARRRMNGEREIGRVLNGTSKLPEAKELKYRLGSYWHEPREVFARLFEQYVATKLGDGVHASTSKPSFYQVAPGWWSAEVFDQLIPMVEAEIQRRMEILRGKADVEANKIRYGTMQPGGGTQPRYLTAEIGLGKSRPSVQIVEAGNGLWEVAKRQYNQDTHIWEFSKLSEPLDLGDAKTQAENYLRENYRIQVEQPKPVEKVPVTLNADATGKKGAVTFMEDGRAIIHAFESADVSTAIHEVGHVFRRELGGADLATVEAWAGVKDGKWERAHEEKFARGFEKYLADGQAPTPKLTGVFEKFKSWMVEIYRGITGSAIDVNIPDQVREVFDRLLTANDEPATVMDRSGQGMMFSNGQDSPLFSGVAQSVVDERFTPKVNETQAQMFQTRPEFGAQVGGKERFAVSFDQAKVDEALAELDLKSLREWAKAMRAEQEGSTLFQDGGEIPLLPVDGFDQTSGYVNVGKLMHEGWANEVRPLLDEMKRAALAPERRYALSGFDDATQRELNSYLQRVKGQMASTKHAAVRWAETQRDQAMLNYSKQYGFDSLLNAGVPYQFFMTRSAVNWAAKVMDRPAWMSQYVRLRNVQNTYQNQLPERMRGKVRIPMPFLPEWAGGGMFIDPSPQFVPFKQFLQPLEAYQRDQNNLANSAGYVLNEWAGDGTYTEKQVQAAQQARSGPVWERAMEEAKIRQNGEGNTGFDYFTMLFGPALYATLPYYLVTGKNPPPSLLPMTRTGMGLEAAFKGTALEPLGNAAGLLAKPEQWVREQKGLSEFGEWGDFYLDRQMANMAAEGKASAKEVQVAMIERKGPIYEEARNRVKQELMLRVPGMAALSGLAKGAQLDQVVGAALPSLFPGGLLPPGEMEYKGLKQEYGLAWDAYKAGNPKAISEFFDRHPEYQARLALRRDPEERLQQFLKSEIWDKYSELGPTNKKQAGALLGSDFGDFLGSEPGVEFSTEKLATWARMLGGMAPTPALPQIPAKNAPLGNTGQAGYLGEGEKIDFFAPEVTGVTDRFFKERTEKFPNYYAIQQGYYNLPKSEQKQYLLKFPELKQYWDWKEKWYKAYPEYQPVFKGEVFRRVDVSGWNPAVVQLVQMYGLTGEKLPKGARQLLEQYWVKAGKPYDNLQSWIDSAVVPGLMYGEGQ